MADNDGAAADDSRDAPRRGITGQHKPRRCKGAAISCICTLLLIAGVVGFWALMAHVDDKRAEQEKARYGTDSNRQDASVLVAKIRAGRVGVAVAWDFLSADPKSNVAR